MKPNGPTCSPKWNQKEAQSVQNGAKSVQNKTKIVSKVSKCAKRWSKKVQNTISRRSVPGRQSALEVLGPERLFFRFIVKNLQFGSQNQCQNSSQMSAKTGTEQNHKFYPNSCFLIIVKTFVFEDVEGCVRERKRYQTNINNDATIHQTSIHQSDFSEKKSSPIGSWSAQ